MPSSPNELDAQDLADLRIFPMWYPALPDDLIAVLEKNEMDGLVYFLDAKSEAGSRLINQKIDPTEYGDRDVLDWITTGSQRWRIQGVPLRLNIHETQILVDTIGGLISRKISVHYVAGIDGATDCWSRIFLRSDMETQSTTVRHELAHILFQTIGKKAITSWVEARCMKNNELLGTPEWEPRLLCLQLVARAHETPVLNTWDDALPDLRYRSTAGALLLVWRNQQDVISFLGELCALLYNVIEDLRVEISWGDVYPGDGILFLADAIRAAHRSRVEFAMQAKGESKREPGNNGILILIAELSIAQIRLRLQPPGRPAARDAIFGNGIFTRTGVKTDTTIPPLIVRTWKSAIEVFLANIDRICSGDAAVSLSVAWEMTLQAFTSILPHVECSSELLYPWLGIIQPASEISRNQVESISEDCRRRGITHLRYRHGSRASWVEALGISAYIKVSDLMSVGDKDMCVGQPYSRLQGSVTEDGLDWCLPAVLYTEGGGVIHTEGAPNYRSHKDLLECVPKPLSFAEDPADHAQDDRICASRGARLHQEIRAKISTSTQVKDTSVQVARIQAHTLLPWSHPDADRFVLRTLDHISPLLGPTRIRLSDEGDFIDMESLLAAKFSHDLDAPIYQGQVPSAVFSVTVLVDLSGSMEDKLHAIQLLHAWGRKALPAAGARIRWVGFQSGTLGDGSLPMAVEYQFGRAAMETVRIVLWPDDAQGLLTRPGYTPVVTCTGWTPIPEALKYVRKTFRPEPGSGAHLLLLLSDGGVAMCWPKDPEMQVKARERERIATHKTFLEQDLSRDLMEAEVDAMRKDGWMIGHVLVGSPIETDRFSNWAGIHTVRTTPENLMESAVSGIEAILIALLQEGRR